MLSGMAFVEQSFGKASHVLQAPRRHPEPRLSGLHTVRVGHVLRSRQYDCEPHHPYTPTVGPPFLMGAGWGKTSKCAFAQLGGSIPYLPVTVCQ